MNLLMNIWHWRYSLWTTLANNGMVFPDVLRQRNHAGTDKSWVGVCLGFAGSRSIDKHVCFVPWKQSPEAGSGTAQSKFLGVRTSFRQHRLPMLRWALCA